MTKTDKPATAGRAARWLVADAVRTLIDCGYTREPNCDTRRTPKQTNNQPRVETGSWRTIAEVRNGDRLIGFGG